ncbi:MAG: hypothetical protein RL328_550 [Acidobacteriota bacterium]
MNDGLTREFLAERDQRIFALRKAGVSTAEIARRFSISHAAVGSAITRQLSKLNREALLAYPEVLRLELERLDALQQAIWPLTQHRKATLDDGTEIAVEPDMRAVQQVLGIIDRRSRLLGMEHVNIHVDIPTAPETIRTSIAGQTPQETNRHDPEQEARALLQLMGESGALPQHIVDTILTPTAELPPPTIEDAEIITEDTQ